MSRELLHEYPGTRLYWDDEVGCVELESLDRSPGDPYQEVLEMILIVMQRRGAHRLLANAREMGKMSEEEMLWMETDWLPRLWKAGVMSIAVVMPGTLGQHMSVDKLTEKVEAAQSGHVRRFFTDAETARDWLKQS